MYKICHEKPKPLSTLDPSIAQAFDPIVTKALEKPLEKRYTSAADFGEALRTAWQVISPKPLSPKLSAEARTIALAMSREPEMERQSRGPLADTWVRPATAGASGVESSADTVAQPNSTGGVGLAAWSRDQLAEIERQLVPIVGPVARILVRNAATTTRSRQEIYRLLSGHLRTPEERQRFLLAGQTGPGSTAPADIPNPTAPSNITRRPLTTEVTQRASQLLARYIGPIATVLTRRAAQTAADEAQLYSMLAEKLADKEERERFLMEAERQH
jgi:serine/threonine-protein kinase